ncbi:MAG: hypothetical protein ACJAXG_001126 [Celeribacter sp.]|jgi:hypothetical protein
MEILKPAWAARRSYVITNGDDAPFTLTTKGRTAWLLDILRLTKGKGITTAELPAGVRVSSALHILRKKGVIVETVMEPHEGKYAGNHGRYFLVSKVHPVFGEAAQ